MDTDRDAAGRNRVLPSLIALAVLLASGGPNGVEAQTPSPGRVGFEVFAGGESESYLRLLQNAGRAGAYPWGIRGFGPGEIERIAPAADVSHPWARRLDYSTSPGWGWLRPRAGMVFNSGWPFGGEGPVWAGRGLTAAFQAGGFARIGPLSLVVAPIVFSARNAEFELAPVDTGGGAEYRNPITPTRIDLPQRFGDETYTRLDPGSSTARLDAGGVVFGVSTAAQQWGPAERNPLVLGAGAGGFPHLFLGTSRPANVWIGRVHGRIVAGRLDQSDWSPVAEGEPRRLMNGLVVTFLPRGVGGLEVGLSRFYHTIWPRTLGLSDFARPLESLLKIDLEDADARSDNQLASVFFRWNFPAAGAEIGGEYMREDHSFDFRTLILEPDDLRSWLLTFRKAWASADDRITLFRAELMDADTPHRMRLGSRPGNEYIRYPLYQHSRVRQGHTLRGQLLSGPFGHGGAASLVALDRYDSAGRWSVEWERIRRADATDFPGTPLTLGTDVIHSLGVSILRFTGRAEITAVVRGMYGLNRDFSSDAFNLNAEIGGAVAF